MKKRKQNKTKKTNSVSIIFRSSQIVITKTNTNSIQYSKVLYQSDTTLSLTENLDRCLSKVPKHFFKQSEITLILPIGLLSTQNISVPDLPEKNLKELIKNQIENANAHYFQYSKLNLSPTSNEFNLLILKTEKLSVETFINVCDKHGLYINNIFSEIDVFSNLFSNSAAPTPLCSEKTEKNWIHLDLNADLLRISIYKENELKFFRTVSLQYQDILKTISKKISANGQELELDSQSAEEFFKTHDIFERKEETSLPLEHIFFLARPAFEKMTMETQKSIQFYFKQIDKAITFDSIFISGQLLNFKNLEYYLSDQLNTKTITPKYNESLFDPSRFEKEVEFTPQLKEITAIGLASCFSNTNTKSIFIPFYYKLQKFHKFVLLFLIISLLGIVPYIVQKSQINTKILNQLDSQLPQLQKERATLIKSFNRLKKQRALDKTVSSKFKLIKEVNNLKLPMEEILFQLNNADIEGIYLTAVDIKENRITIKASADKEMAQQIIPNYIENLEGIKPLSDLEFDILNGLTSVQLNISGIVGKKLKKGNDE